MDETNAATNRPGGAGDDLSLAGLKARLAARDPEFHPALARAARAATACEDALFLDTLRRRALRDLPAPAGVPLRLGLVGGCGLYPLRALVELGLFAAGFDATVYAGEFDDYVASLREADGPLQRFQPQVTVVLPTSARCRYEGALTDGRERIAGAAARVADELIDLCSAHIARTGSQVLCGNFVPPAGFDPGAYRTRTLATDWSFRRLVNLELGLRAPTGVQILDLDFLASRRGLLASQSARGFFESKQPGAPEHVWDIAREVAHLCERRLRAPRKVLVLDLDNTIWGGVIGDDGLTGIELGASSPRGEAFRAFQSYALALRRRGVLLAVCSKNNPETALEPFERHPEMLLRRSDIASFQASWEPKPEGLRAIARELNLGLDSLVFVDDNPAEIAIVERFLPEVQAILLGPDPADYVAQLADARCLEPQGLVTREDLARAGQYQAEAARQRALAESGDYAGYLASLEMTAVLRPVGALDLPRVAQIINKSNQFNLTTRRRSEAEMAALAADPGRRCFSLRLADRFGDHGLVVAVIGEVCAEAGGPVFVIDTWVMSCRVLKRQVEDVTLNEILRLSAAAGCRRVRGRYLPSGRNQLVADLYPRLGFRAIEECGVGEGASARAPGQEGAVDYELEVAGFQPLATAITVRREDAGEAHAARKDPP